MANITIKGNEVQNPLLRVLLTIFGLLVAAAAIVFIVLPILGFVLSLTTGILIVVFTALVIGIPIAKIKGNKRINFHIHEKDLITTASSTQSFDSTGISKIRVMSKKGNTSISGNNSDISVTLENAPNFRYKIDGAVLTIVNDVADGANIKLLMPSTLEIELMQGAGNVYVADANGNLDASIGAGNFESKNLKVSANIKLGAGNVMLNYDEVNPTVDAKVQIGAGNTLVSLPENSTVNAKFTKVIGSLKSDFENSDSGLFKIVATTATGKLQISKR